MPEWGGGHTTLETIVQELQRPVRFDDSFERRVMVRVRRLHAERRSRGWVAIASRITHRPGWAAALAACVVAVVTLGLVRNRPESVANAGAVPVEPVQFVLVAPEAHSVAVVFGGRSNEHAISCVSAGSILRNLDPERFDVLAIGITPEGSWVLTDGDPAALAITDRQLPEVTAASGTELALPADPGRSGQLVSLAPGASEVLASVDVVFPVLHGPYGEDGTIQGLLELAGVPYVGAGVLASAAGMDKEFTKKLFAAEGLPIGDYAVLRPSHSTLRPEECERLGLPVFVKPARGGSSIGVSRVSSWDQLDGAIAMARRHDPKVIVEAAVVGRELECGVLEMPDGTVEASTLGEIRVAGVRGREDSFYDFSTKYLDDAAELDVPAKVDDEIADTVRHLAVQAFKAIDCQGLARVDFFLTEDGPVLNEINTMPGFTTISMYPRMWAASGVDYATLLATMVQTALARGVGLR